MYVFLEMAVLGFVRTVVWAAWKAVDLLNLAGWSEEFQQDSEAECLALLVCLWEILVAALVDYILVQVDWKAEDSG